MTEKGATRRSHWVAVRLCGATIAVGVAVGSVLAANGVPWIGAALIGAACPAVGIVPIIFLDRHVVVEEPGSGVRRRRIRARVTVYGAVVVAVAIAVVLSHGGMRPIWSAIIGAGVAVLVIVAVIVVNRREIVNEQRADRDNTR